jgi:tRNA (mo5U34)-methyltransferase
MSQQQIKSKIIEYYRDILCREPDKDGLDHYLKMANNGTTLEKIRELFLESDEYSFLKSSKFLKYAPSFKTSFSDDEVKKMFGSVDWWYHYFKIGNVENTNTKTSRNYQMWVSSIIPENLENKTVLDIGTADGYYSFLCESRGAKKVVAVDWTEFPGFTVTHKVLNSKVEFRKLVIDDSTIGFTKIKSQVGTIDEIKEKFDVVLFFGVLYHIPSPIMVIQKLFKNTSMLLIASHIIDSKEPAMYYYPEYSLTPGDTTNWWVPTPSCLTDIGKRIGFMKSDLVDTFDFDSINATPQQTDEVKSGIRRIHKVGLFKMEGTSKTYAELDKTVDSKGLVAEKYWKRWYFSKEGKGLCIHGRVVAECEECVAGGLF